MNAFQLRCVLAVAEHRSFTQAAKELFISQPTLSSTIQRIETEHGVSLFDRSTIPLTLTYAGEIYLSQAKEMLLLNENLHRKLQEISNNKLGRIRICLTQDRLPYIFPSLLASFSQKYPNIAVQGFTYPLSEIIERVNNRQTDFGIVPNFNGTLKLGKDTVSEDLCREELVLVSSDKYVDPSYTVPGLSNTIDMKKLSNIPLILLPDNHYISSVLKIIFEQYGIEPSIALQINNNISAYRLATAGFSSAIIPKMMTYWVSPAGKVQHYSLTPCGIYWTVQIIYNKSAYMGTLERNFISELRNVLATGGQNQ